MATTARQTKPQRKGPPDAGRRAPAWNNARASPTYRPTSPRAPGSAPAGGFPPLAGRANGAGTPNQQERMLAQIAGLTGTTITLTTRAHTRYEGVVGSAGNDGVTLRDARDLGAPGAPIRESLFVAAADVEAYSSGPAGASAPPNGVNGAGANGNGNGVDSFKTDTDISKASAPKARELKAWADDNPDEPAPLSPPLLPTTGSARDELTFGSGAGGGAWDQFAANERLFGVRAGFDEEAYTTKLDRSAPDFKERERRAAAIANEIMQSTANNAHVAEERTQNFVGESGTNEEEKYGAVVRGANAYVPPGARKAASGKSELPKVAVTPAAEKEKEKEKEKKEDGAKKDEKEKEGKGTPPPKAASPAPSAENKPAADAVPAFREFVSSEKDRLMKKKQALMKNEMDKRMAELVKFSQSFKLNKPIPDDLVPILAKDEEKQRQIREKATKDAASTRARAIGAFSATPSTGAAPSANAPNGSPTPGSSESKPAKLVEGKSGRISMVIQPIPPFKGKRASAAAPSPARAAAAAARETAPMSPATQARLNVNASLFRPTTTTTTTTTTTKAGAAPTNGVANGTASPKPKQAEAAASPQQAAPNPFFGRALKKSPPVHIKDDFNPFKHAKYVEASQINPTWPYNGKRYSFMFPPIQTPPQQQSPPMAHPPPPSGMPPPPYEEGDSAAAQAAAAAAARGYMYYPPYYPGQPMMPGMGPPPPGAYMPAPPFMQPMPYPHMPPNAMYPGPPMAQMPPPQAYMPPPGAYPPPPNGVGPRPSMPPTPVPSHAHPYYHQSPQLQHAVPYPMMMPPPPPHGYDPSQAPPVQMGGVGHA